MLTTIAENHLIKLCARDNVLHLRLHDTLTMPDLVVLESAFGKLVQAYPKGFAILVTTRAVDHTPPQELRQAASAMIGRYEKHLAAVAVVIELEGLKATILRTIINTVMLTARVRQTRIFNSASVAVPWLTERMKAADCVTVAVEHLLEDVREMARTDSKAKGSARAVQTPTATS